MKKNCLEHLVCPSCDADSLTISVSEVDGEEIMDATISCSCGKTYPVIKGVPRMMYGPLLDSVLTEYRRQGSDHNDNTSKSDSVSDVQKGTMDAFGYEWRHYADYDADNYYHWMPEGFSPEAEFRDRTGLEVGCGAGRHAELTSQWAKTHFAVDLSYAVDSAFERTKHFANCHVIQADAFSLPFQQESFDYVYCLGVLQHMHEPPKGFAQLAKQVRPGGVLLANVYQASRPVAIATLEMLRKITTKMSPPLLNKFCILFGTLDYMLSTVWRGVEKVKLAKVLGPLFPQRTKEYARHTYKTVVADWYDRLSCPKKFHYTKEQLASWYEKVGFTRVRVSPYWDAFWNGYGVKEQN